MTREEDPPINLENNPVFDHSDGTFHCYHTVKVRSRNEKHEFNEAPIVCCICYDFEKGNMDL